MNRLFADSYYFFGLLNPRDEAHEACVKHAQESKSALITTAWVFTEIADGFLPDKKSTLGEKAS